jgi:hypothetical protein
MCFNIAFESHMKFPQLLTYLIDSDKYRLVDLASSSGLHNTDLSKLVRGKRPCGVKSFGTILNGLRPEHQVQAISAWISDQLAPEHLALIHIVPAVEQVKEDVPDVRTLEGALSVLGEQAAGNPALRMVLTNMAVAFTSASAPSADHSAVVTLEPTG